MDLEQVRYLLGGQQFIRHARECCLHNKPCQAMILVDILNPRCITRMVCSITTALTDEQADLHVPQWTLGDRLAKARKDAGLSQKEMAERLEVTAAAVLGG